MLLTVTPQDFYKTRGTPHTQMPREYFMADESAPMLLDALRLAVAVVVWCVYVRSVFGD